MLASAAAAVLMNAPSAQFLSKVMLLLSTQVPASNAALAQAFALLTHPRLNNQKTAEREGAAFPLCFFTQILILIKSMIKLISKEKKILENALLIF